MSNKLEELDSRIDRYVEIYKTDTLTLPIIVEAYCTIVGLSANENDEILVFMELLREYYSIDTDDNEKFNQIETMIFETYSKMYDHLKSPDNESTTKYNDINTMSGVEFEQLIFKLLKAMGLEVSTTRTTADGGIDLIARSNQAFFEGKYIVQCKRYSGTVGEPPLRDLYGVVMSERANKGILITNSTFTTNAVNFAYDKPLELIDGQKLLTLLNNYNMTEESVNSSGINVIDESNAEREEFNVLRSELRINPNNLRLRVKYIYKLIVEIKRFHISNSSSDVLSYIKECETQLLFIINSNNFPSKKRGEFIKHLAFAQMGILKVHQGEIAEAIKYYLRANDFKNLNNLNQVNKGDVDLDLFFLANIISIIHLLDFLGETAISTKLKNIYPEKMKYGNQILKVDVNKKFINYPHYVYHTYFINEDFDEYFKGFIEDEEDECFFILYEHCYFNFDMGIKYTRFYKEIFQFSEEEKNRQARIARAYF